MQPCPLARGPYVGLHGDVVRGYDLINRTSGAGERVVGQVSAVRYAGAMTLISSFGAWYSHWVWGLDMRARASFSVRALSWS